MKKWRPFRHAEVAANENEDFPLMEIRGNNDTTIDVQLAGEDDSATTFVVIVRGSDDVSEETQTEQEPLSLQSDVTGTQDEGQPADGPLATYLDARSGRLTDVKAETSQDSDLMTLTQDPKDVTMGMWSRRRRSREPRLVTVDMAVGEEMTSEVVTLAVAADATQCPVCGKQFRQHHNMLIHLETHSAEKKFTCEKCGVGFTRKHTMKVHVNSVHNGILPHKCDLCGAGFPTSGLLVRHQRRHTGDRPFRCATCGKGFKQRTHLTTHERLKHGPDRAHKRVNDGVVLNTAPPPLLTPPTVVEIDSNMMDASCPEEIAASVLQVLSAGRGALLSPGLEGHVVDPGALVQLTAPSGGDVQVMKSEARTGGLESLAQTVQTVTGGAGQVIYYQLPQEKS